MATKLLKVVAEAAYAESFEDACGVRAVQHAGGIPKAARFSVRAFV